jgi:hypothetical protein
MAHSHSAKHSLRDRKHEAVETDQLVADNACSESAEELVKQLWNLGNVITAFTVAQSLTGIYFILEKPALVKIMKVYAIPGCSVIMAGAGVYCVAIWSCHRLECNLRASLGQPPVVLRTSRKVMRARLATILMFNSIFVSIGLVATQTDIFAAVDAASK